MIFKRLVSSIFSSLVLAGSVLFAQETTAPNILFILADDMGPHLGCYGDPIAKTPNMDKIAKEGVRFDNAWVTQASCSPSRSSIMTGLYPHQNGQIGLAHLGFSMSGNFDSIPSLLKAAGYYTGVIGKMHVKPVSSLPFDYMIEPGQFDVRDVNACSEKMREFLAKAGDKPVFLNMSYTDPHRPFMEQHKGFPVNPLKHENAKLLPFMKGCEKIAGLLEEVTGYYNGIMRVDAAVGAALDEMKKAGRLDNTVIVLIGDHGAPFGRGKVTCYNPGMHIPFLVKWPGVSKAGTSSQALVSTIDLLPTFLDVAGAKKPDALPGKSVRPVVADPSADLREYMFGEFTAHLPADYYPRFTVRNKRYQLIENLLSPAPNPTPGIEGLAERNAVKVDGMITSPSKQAIEAYVKPPRYELFDLKNDPENFNNLAGKPEYKAIQDKLQAELDAWRRRSNDPLLKPGEIERVRQDIRARMDTKFSGVKGVKKNGKQKKGSKVEAE